MLKNEIIQPSTNRRLPHKEQDIREILRENDRRRRADTLPPRASLLGFAVCWFVVFGLLAAVWWGL